MVFFALFACIITGPHHKTFHLPPYHYPKNPTPTATIVTIHPPATGQVPQVCPGFSNHRSGDPTVVH